MRHQAALLILLALASCAPERATVPGERRATLDLSRIVLRENSVPTIELGDDGTVVNLLSSRPGPIIQHRCGPQVLQAELLAEAIRLPVVEQVLLPAHCLALAWVMHLVQPFPVPVAHPIILLHTEEYHAASRE